MLSYWNRRASLGAQSKTPRKDNLARPYVTWVDPDGREIMADRRYKPMWQRMPRGSATPATPSEWTQSTRHAYLWGPGPTTMRQSIAAGRAALRSWGVPA